MASSGAIPAATRSIETFKPRDVEELVDLYLHRRVAALLVRVLAKTSVTPNQVTVASGLTAIVAGTMVGMSSPETPYLSLLGAGTFFLSIVLDCADGQLARLRKSYSFFGRALDGYVDVVSTAAMYLGLFGFLVGVGDHVWPGFVLAWAAGFSMKWHTHGYDHIKNIYLLNTTPPDLGREAFPSYEDIDRERDAHLAAGRRFHALVVRGFRHLTESQRRGLTGRAGLDLPAMKNDEERAAYRSLFRRFARVWTFNGLGTHLILFVIAAAALPWFPRAPFVLWGFIAGPMNLMTLCLRIWETRLEARLAVSRGTAAERLAADPGA